MFQRTYSFVAKRVKTMYRYPWEKWVGFFATPAALLLLVAVHIAAAPHTVAYQLEKPGQVSAAVYDGDGRLVRTLLRAEQQDVPGEPFDWDTRDFLPSLAPLHENAPGQYTLTWDGLDRYGRPVPPGEYEVRILRKPPFKAEFRFQVGVNPDSGRHHRWLGNHSGAANVTVDGSGVYIGAATTEGPPMLLKQSIDGTKRHWIKDRRPILWAAGSNGQVPAIDSDGKGRLYLLQTNGMITPINGETGRAQVKTNYQQNRTGIWDPLPEAVLKQYDKRKQVGRRYGRHGQPDADLAAEGDTLVVCFEDQDMVRWVNTENGSVETTINVPAPRSVAVGPKKQVFVLSEQRVLRVDRSGESHPVIDRHLAAPKRIAVDPVGGDLLVVEGAPDHRVKRFAADGTLKRSYGRKGGREEGPYDPTDFKGVADVAPDGKGGFFVAEPDVAPRRTAHFTRDGSLINEWYGGQPFFSWKVIDPRDPTKIWFYSGGGDVVYAEVDYEARSWRVLETHHLPSKAQGLGRSASHNWHYSVVYHDGERYLMGESLPQVFHHKDGKLLPLVCSGKARDGSAEALAGILGGDPGNYRGKFYYWADANGDRAPQADEIVTGPSSEGSGYSVAPDGSILFGTGNTLYRLPFTGWVDGVPQYPITSNGRSAEQVGRLEPDVETDLVSGRFGNLSHVRGINHSFTGADGAFYATYEFGPNHGTGWPTKHYGGRSRLARWDRNGDRRWTVGRHAIHRLRQENDRVSRPGTIHQPSDISGEARDAIFLTDRVKTPGMVYGKDGLYLGYVGDTRAHDGLPRKVYDTGPSTGLFGGMMGGDSKMGGAVTEYNGAVYWFAPESQASTVYRIHGWENWRRISETVTLQERASGADGNGSGLNGTYFTNDELEGNPAVERVDRQVWFGLDRSTNRSAEDAVIDSHRLPEGNDWAGGDLPIDDRSAFLNKNGKMGSDGRTNMQPFSVRWTGKVEAHLTESFVFSVYVRGGVRLWIDGELVIDKWDGDGNMYESRPIDLEVGERVPVRLEFRSSHRFPACSLNWESFSQERERIPEAYLYPTEDSGRGK